jgi:hypothetical protein
VKDYIARFFLSIFVVKIQGQNAMVGDEDDRPEVSLLFVVATGTYRYLAWHKISGYVCVVL